MGRGEVVFFTSWNRSGSSRYINCVRGNSGTKIRETKVLTEKIQAHKSGSGRAETVYKLHSPVPLPP